VSEEKDREIEAEVKVQEASSVEEGEETEAPTEGIEQEGVKAREKELIDELTALRQELEETKAKEAEYLDGWQRARAELANARKRFQREREQVYGNAKSDILVRLLSIVDDFERAAETMPENLSGLTWIQGVMLIRRQLQKLLEQDGVAPMEAVGQEFDPFTHEAVTHEPSETMQEGYVIAELQKGYKMGERVLRPSMVRVSSGPPSKDEAEAEDTEPTPPEESPEKDQTQPETT
jgi:molecular chaperone GrpE